MGRKCKENGSERRRQREGGRKKGSCSVSYPLSGDVNCVSHTHGGNKGRVPISQSSEKAMETPDFWDKNHRI